MEREIGSSNLNDKEGALKTYKEAAKGKSNSEARLIAADILNKPVSWDWDAPRTREGYYHYTGGIEAAIKRSIAFAPYADLLWLETKAPNLQQATSFARRIRTEHPGKYVVEGSTAKASGTLTRVQVDGV